MKAPQALVVAGVGVGVWYIAGKLENSAALVGRTVGLAIAGYGVFQLFGELSGKGNLTDAALGEIGLDPARSDIDSLEHYVLQARLPNNGQLQGRWTRPLTDSVVARNRIGGDEYDVQFEIENHGVSDRTVELVAVVVENDITADDPVPMPLGRVFLTAGRGVRASGQLRLITFAILTGRVDVTATLIADGAPLATVNYRVG